MGTTILSVGKIAFEIYYWMILFYILSSWLPKLQSSKVGVLVGDLVEPYLSFFRRFIPPIGMVDLSSIVALLAYQFIGSFALLGLGQIVKTLGLL